VRRLLLKLDPDLVKKRYEASIALRNVSHTEHADGTASITGRFLPKETAAAVFDHLNRMTGAVKRASRQPGAPIPADTRTNDQVRADLFLDLLRGVDPVTAGTAAPGPRKGEVHLTVELLTLLRLNDEPGELAGFGPVTADIARQLAQRYEQGGRWRFQVTHDGRLIHEGRLHYRPTTDQAAYVRARDKRCQAPGCRRPAHQCDLDHTTRWTDGGPSIEDNLASLCRRHHRAKDSGGYRVYRTDFGLVWITPRGRAYPVPLGRELDNDQRRILQHLINEGEKRRTPMRT
jgi:Domain of unknown function (DUF222)/HNH endonuclease